VTFSINVVHWRDLVKGCNLSSGRFSYTTIGQSVKHRNSEWNALRTREIILRSPISIPLRFTAEGGGSFSATPWQLHSKESLPKGNILHIAKFAGLFLTFRQKRRILLAISFDRLLILTALSTALSPEK
jgi:hypothetical protein